MAIRRPPGWSRSTRSASALPDLKAAAAESLLELRHEVFVELESQHSLEPLQQRFSQRPASRADFKDPRRFVFECRHNPLGDTGVDEEVLTQLAAFGSSHVRQISDFGFRISDLPGRHKGKWLVGEKFEIRNPKSEIQVSIISVGRLRRGLWQSVRSRRRARRSPRERRCG